jgi:hypothetical protein
MTPVKLHRFLLDTFNGLSDFLVAAAFVFERLRNATETPHTMRTARGNLLMWAGASLIAANGLFWQVLAAGTAGEWWSWWYVIHGPCLALDVAMLRSAAIGYAYRKTKDAEQAEFEKIVAGIE